MAWLGAMLAPGERVTFARFMELALYHPQWGYYSRKKEAYPAGPQGDFVTAPTAHPGFASVLAKMLALLAESRGQALTFVDLGAGDGHLLWNLSRCVAPGTVDRWLAVEVSPAGREALASGCPQAEVVAELAAAAPPSGPCVVFASELYDALPFHVLEKREEGIYELYVEAGNDGTLRWVASSPSSPALLDYLATYGLTLVPGQRVEVRPQAQRFHQKTLGWAGDDALMLVVDYGYPARSLYNPRARRWGSLAAYRRHQVSLEVLACPGEVDITAHVNWDDLLIAGRHLGFGFKSVEPLGLFLTRWGLLEGVGAHEPWVPWGVKVLVHPAGMGSDLKVLLQGKGVLWQCWQELDRQKTV